MAKDLAIILNNGGINAAVATALAAQKYRPILVFAETGAVSAPSPARAAYDQQVAHFKPFREHTLAMPFVGTVEPPRAGGASGAAPAQASSSVAAASAAAAAASDPRHHAPLGPQMIMLLPLVSAAVRIAAHYQAGRG